LAPGLDQRHAHQAALAQRGTYRAHPRHANLGRPIGLHTAAHGVWSGGGILVHYCQRAQHSQFVVGEDHPSPRAQASVSSIAASSTSARPAAKAASYDYYTGRVKFKK
jgi:hypothetical protein